MVAWCCANYLAFNTLGVPSLSLFPTSLIISLWKLVYRDKSRMLSTLRWPVTRAASRVSFGLYARLLLTRNYQWHRATIAKSQAGRASESEYLSYLPTRIPIGRVVGEGGEMKLAVREYRDTDWQVFPRVRENRSRNSRTRIPAIDRPIFRNLK